MARYTHVQIRLGANGEISIVIVFAPNGLVEKSFDLITYYPDLTFKVSNKGEHAPLVSGHVTQQLNQFGPKNWRFSHLCEQLIGSYKGNPVKRQMTGRIFPCVLEKW